MGSLFSRPENTNPGAVLNFILREMFQRADIVDIYSLADKGRCARYIVAGADALESLFVKIRIQPARTKDGVLYFQSIDGLLKAMPQELKDIRRQYCMELSFFFIRIFQIFGSLSLTIFDSSLPLTNPSDEVLTKSEQQKRGVFFNPKDFYGLTQAAEAPKGGLFSFFGFGGGQTGGRLDPQRDYGQFYIKDGSYKILNFHLSRPDAGSDSTDPMKIEGYPIHLAQNSLYNFTNNGVATRRVKSEPTPLLQYRYTRNSNVYTLTATLQITGVDDYTVTLSKYTNDGTPAQNVRTPSETLSSFDGGVPTSTGQAFPVTKGKTLPAVLQAMFDSAATQILGAIPFSVVKFLRNMRYLNGTQNADGTISGTHVSVPGSQENSDNPRIIFTDSAQLGEEEEGRRQKRRVRITANLQIDEPRQDVLKGIYTYKVTVDFSNSQVDPSELKDNLKSYRTANFVAYSKDAAPKHDKNDMTIPQYLESVFQEVIKGSETNNSNSGIKYTRSGIPKPFDSDGIPEDLKIKELWKALAKDPPVKSHCVARAVQLLSVDAIRGNMSVPAFSSACRLQFAYQKDGSIPAPGKPITDAYGMHALATLFWTELYKNTPKIQDDAKYKDFLQFLQAAMGGEGEPEKMSKISDRLPAVCDGREDSRLDVSKGLAYQLRVVAKDLLNQQKTHVNAAMGIMGLMFDMDSIVNKKQFTFNQAVLSGGMPEVERIAGLARDLLVNYYRGCEKTYRDGVGLIYKADESAPLGAKRMDGTAIPPRIPAPPAPPAPAPAPAPPTLAAAGPV